MVFAKAGLGSAVCRGAHMAGGHGGRTGTGRSLATVEISYCLLSYFDKKIPRKINESLVSRWQLRVWAMVFLPPVAWVLQDPELLALSQTKLLFLR